MKKILLLLLVLLAINLVTAQTMTLREFELEVWRLTNVERVRHSLQPLTYEEGLADLARTHSGNMLVHKFFAHKDHKGDEVGGRREKYYPNLLVSAIGENLGKFSNSAMRFTPHELVSGWMQSPLHRENILNPIYTHLGVGLVFKGDTLYATQNFATPTVRFKGKIPDRLDHKKVYRLSFDYLSPKPANQLTATILFPNKKVSFKVSDEQEMVGAQPLSIRWTSATTFDVDVPFNGGKGEYQLCFGFNGGYFPEGLKLRAR
jgi:hypothetical protein